MNKEKKKPKAILPKGFKDNVQELLDLRNTVTETIREECQKFGFTELETSSIEYTDVLGKFLPDKDRPSGGVFSFQDDDNQWLSLRYDLTAPLARFVAQNYQDLVKPFKRFQSGIVWRNEKPGPGRYREFLQFDADVVGVESAYIDAELCVMVAKIFDRLGFKPDEYQIKYSNRKIWDEFLSGSLGLSLPENQIPYILRAIDKLDRLGNEEVRKLLTNGRKDPSGDFMEGVGLSDKNADSILRMIEEKTIMLATPDVEGQIQIEQFQRYLSNYKNYPIIFDPSIVRGLDYYTGMVFEAEVLLNVKNKKGQDVIFGSVAGGGRYDKLIARFGKEDVPATGISIGVDRLIVAMQQKKLLEIKTPPLVVIANMDNNQLSEYLKMADELRDVGIACEVSYGSKNLAKQLKYCDRKKANIVVIAGDSEIENGVVSIKDLAAGKELSKKITEREEWKESKAGQFEVKRKEFIRAIKKILDKQ